MAYLYNTVNTSLFFTDESSSIPSPVQSETDQQPPDHDMYVELSVDLNSDTRRGAAAYQTIWD